MPVLLCLPGMAAEATSINRAPFSGGRSPFVWIASKRVREVSLCNCTERKIFRGCGYCLLAQPAREYFYLTAHFKIGKVWPVGISLACLAPRFVAHPPGHQLFGNCGQTQPNLARTTSAHIFSSSLITPRSTTKLRRASAAASTGNSEISLSNFASVGY